MDGESLRRGDVVSRRVSEIGSVTWKIRRIGNVVSVESRHSVDGSGAVAWLTTMRFGFTNVAVLRLRRSVLFVLGR